MKTFRLIIDGPTDGVRNMAVDEALLAAVHKDGALPVLRWYRWERPTLSLGYFQGWNDVPPKLQQLPRLRRSTGGGAILHDLSELTYSLALPNGSWPRKFALQIVGDVHAAVAQAVQELDAIQFLSTAKPSPKVPRDQEPFLCFDRRSANDLVAGADKIMGSAQRRQGGCLLQHGSIKPRGVHVDLLIARVTRNLEWLWKCTFEPSDLSESELAAANESAIKHRSEEWTLRR
jgi:lipoate-protein ligase A